MTPSGIDPRYLRRVRLKIETAGSADDYYAAPCCFSLILFYSSSRNTRNLSHETGRKKQEAGPELLNNVQTPIDKVV